MKDEHTGVGKKSAALLCPVVSVVLARCPGPMLASAVSPAQPTRQCERK